MGTLKELEFGFDRFDSPIKHKEEHGAETPQISFWEAEQLGIEEAIQQVEPLVVKERYEEQQRT